MKRTGNVDVKITPPSQAVSKELEGDWDGSLPGRGDSVTFHIKNLTDQTVEATITSLSLALKTQAFVRVAQSGADVEFTLFILAGALRGRSTVTAMKWLERGLRILVRRPFHL